MIRLATKDDLKALAPIYVIAYNSLNIGEQWTDKKAIILLEHLYNEQPDLFFVAVEGNNIIGGITAVVKPWWDGNHLTDGELFINPDYQGKGIGKQLIQTLFENADKKYQAVSWDTFTHRVYEHPLNWYKSMGFKEIKEWVMITGDIQEVLNNLKQK